MFYHYDKYIYILLHICLESKHIKSALIPMLNIEMDEYTYHICSGRRDISYVYFIDTRCDRKTPIFLQSILFFVREWLESIFRV